MLNTRRKVEGPYGPLIHYGNGKLPIGIDFDKTIAQQLSVWDGKWYNTGDPIPGALEFLREVDKKYQIIINSVRCTHFTGRLGIRKWFRTHLPGMKVKLAKKPFCVMYIDDMAYHFKWDYSELYKMLGLSKSD